MSRQLPSLTKVRRAGFGLRVSGFGFRASGVGLRASGCELQVLGFGLRVSGSGFGFRVSGVGLRVAGPWFSSSLADRLPPSSAWSLLRGLRFRVGVLGLRVWRLGCRVRVHD